MEIRLVEQVPAQIKQDCAACGVWDRPGEPAFFIVGESNGWICARCVEKGEDHIRQGFRHQAERFHGVAEAYEKAAEEEIMINELELQRFRAAARWQREKDEAYIARQGARDPDDLPF